MATDSPRLQSENPSALPLGTRLGEFELRSLLGVGGFGIVYLAFDHALEREVAVKEYMPASLAGRTETMHVSLRSQSDADTFALGLKSFVNEAKLLARFDHPSLLKVHRFWEANGTAYMAMPVMRGRTLKEVRAEMMAAPDEAWLRAVLTPLLGAIEKLHSEGVYHRDIAPDNIQIEPDGHPVLLDFGAARHVISGKTQTLTAILKPAYAPIEQYAEVGSVKQGPWTDLYALGATLHYMLLGRPPSPATARAVHDEASALAVQACPGCSEDFLRTVDWMLAPRPIDRPQSVAALRVVLEGRAPPPLRRAEAAPSSSQWERTVLVAPSVATTRPAAFDDDQATRILPPSAAAASAPPTFAAVDLPVPAAAPAPLPPPARLPQAEFSAPPVSGSLSAAPVPLSRPRWLPVAAGLGAVAVAVAAFALWPRQAAAPAAPAAVAEPVPVVTAPVPPTPASSAVPESAIATVVVPAPAARLATSDTAPAGPGSRPVPRTGGDKAGGAARAGTGAAAAGATGSLPSPAQPPNERMHQQTDKPTPVAAPVPVAPAGPAPEPPKPAVATGPEAKCGARNALSYFFCMERECLRSEFSAHADCLKWRKEAKRE